MAFARAVKGIPQVSGAAFLHVKVTVGGCIRLISRGSPPNVVQQIVRGIKQFPISAKIIVALRKPMPRIDVIEAFNFSTKCSILPINLRYLDIQFTDKLDSMLRFKGLSDGVFSSPPPHLVCNGRWTQFQKVLSTLSNGPMNLFGNEECLQQCVSRGRVKR